MKIRLSSRSHCYRAIASALLIFLTMTTLVVGMAGCVTTGGPSEDLEIRTWDDLNLVRYNLAGHHILMNDLDATTDGYDDLAGPTAYGGRGWLPIGLYPDGDSEFAGTFDGQGYEIRDLFINRTETNIFDQVGLFGNSKGDIENVGVVNATVVGYHGVGGLVGMNIDGTVSNCYFSGHVTGLQADVGGLVGDNGGVVRDSYCIGNVTVTCDSDFGVLVGTNTAFGVMGTSYEGTVINSHYNYNEALINGENIITLGALFGEDFNEWLANDMFLDVNERLSQEDGYYMVSNITDFKQLLAFGMDDSLRFRLTDDLDLSGEPNFYIPYFAGEFDGNGHRISNLSFEFAWISYIGLFGHLAYGATVNDVAVENVNINGYDYVGGLVGWNEGDVSGSYSTGSVAGFHRVGGLVGWNEGDVSNSYSTGSIHGGGGGAFGGLVGRNEYGAVSNSYSTGNVTGYYFAGGLVGANSGISASNSFWDTETSGQTISAGGTGKTTVEMQDITTFSGATWDIVAVNDTDERDTMYIWNIVDDETYPFLSWESVS